MTPLPPSSLDHTLLHGETVGGRPLHLIRTGTTDDVPSDGVQLRLVASDYASQLRRRCTLALSVAGCYAATLHSASPLWHASCVGVVCVLLARIVWLVESGQCAPWRRGMNATNNISSRFSFATRAQRRSR